MPILGTLIEFTPGGTIHDSDFDQNFADIRDWANAWPVLKDVAGEITVAHTFTVGLLTNTITERTAAAGVTVDGVLLKDGLVGPTYGGTGLASFAQGTLLYGSAANVW